MRFSAFEQRFGGNLTRGESVDDEGRLLDRSQETCIRLFQAHAAYHRLC